MRCRPRPRRRAAAPPLSQPPPPQPPQPPQRRSSKRTLGHFRHGRRLNHRLRCRHQCVPPPSRPVRRLAASSPHPRLRPRPRLAEPRTPSTPLMSTVTQSPRRLRWRQPWCCPPARCRPARPISTYVRPLPTHNCRRRRSHFTRCPRRLPRRQARRCPRLGARVPWVLSAGSQVPPPC